MRPHPHSAILCLALAACMSDPKKPAPEPEDEADAAPTGGKSGGSTPDARATDTAPASVDTGGSGGAGTGGSPGTGGSVSPDAGADAASGTGGSSGDAAPAARFSFFVTSLAAMRELSQSQQGFGGDLRFGEATGLAGADKICRTIAEKGMPGAGQKTWRAFLSASTGGAGGGPVNAIDRIGEGPWYDRMGRLFSMNRAGLLAGPRPQGDPALVVDFTNETGAPNKMGTDNHDTLTGSDKQGRYGGSMGVTCNDWTSAVGSTGRPMIGHAWPRNPGNLGSGGHWISDHSAPGCAPGVNISSGGGGGGATVGGGGGYGGIYCFALTP